MSTRNSKKWSDLSPDRRRRLSKKGITQRMHDAGLREATYDKVMYEAVEFYGADPEDVHHALATTDPAQIEAAVKLQDRMWRAFVLGDDEAARGLWEQRDQELADYFSHYHKVFS